MENKEKYVGVLFIAMALVVILDIVILIFSFRFDGAKKTIKVGGVFIGDMTDNGWNQSHYEGLHDACEKLSCSFLIKDHVPEERIHVENAIRNLVDEGCSVLFLTSYGYGDYVAEIAKEHPKVAFYSISGKGKADNFTSYFPRLYQSRYLSGIVAGMTTKTDTLGMVASMPITETNRDINAFTMGAKKANPDVRVLVKFTGSWNNEKKEKAAVKLLAEQGVDLITYHQDKPTAIDEAEKRGLYSVGYNGVYSHRSERFLTAALANWEAMYERLLGDYLSGRANFSNSYWLGISEKAISLYPYSKLVDKKTKKLVEKEEKRIQTWRDVFSGEIYDNTGVLRCKEDEIISDEELFNGMNWYVDGVEIYENDK